MNNDNQHPVVQEPLPDEDDDWTTVTLEAEEHEDFDEWDMEEDDRGCERCSGCAYCQDSGGYDGADEV